MCRLAAFPPGTSQAEAEDITDNFERHNKDGVGVGYLRGNQFVVKKYPMSFTDAYVKDLDLFKHMPCDGWTTVHLRQKTHGEPSYVNTHPFIKGHYLVCHNGMFGKYNLIKAALRGAVKFNGDTDSEVAAYLIHKLGPKEAYGLFSYDGVFLAMDRAGALWAINTGSHDLVIHRTATNKCLVASELSYKHYKPIHFGPGYVQFDKTGKAIDMEKDTSHTWEKGHWVRNPSEGTSYFRQQIFPYLVDSMSGS